MGVFIEVTPIRYGEEKPRMLINTDKIDYVREDSDGLAVIYLKDIPLAPFTKEPVFDNPIYAVAPFIAISDDITKAKEADDGND